MIFDSVQLTRHYLYFKQFVFITAKGLFLQNIIKYLTETPYIIKLVYRILAVNQVFPVLSGGYHTRFVPKVSVLIFLCTNW